MKSLNKQFVLAGLATLALSAVVVGCSKSDVDNAYDKTTNAMEVTKDVTTNAAVHAWTATKEGAEKVGDAMTNVAAEVKTGVTNTWEKITSTNH